MASSHLNRARKEKNDEFYTPLSTIEAELNLPFYQEYLRDKTIYCNADDYPASKFIDYFISNYSKIRYKKLIATGKLYNTAVEYDGSRLVRYELEDGDFRSKASVRYLTHADVVITNPPFSLFRAYLTQLLEHKKDFLFIGSFSQIHGNTFWPLFVNEEIWFGHTLRNHSIKFYCSAHYEKVKLDEEMRYCKNVQGIAWFSNICKENRIKPPFLKLTKKYTPSEYPEFNYYYAINVDKTKDIPMDYNGVMGVPISFATKLNRDQFEIVDYLPCLALL